MDLKMVTLSLSDRTAFIIVSEAPGGGFKTRISWEGRDGASEVFPYLAMALARQEEYAAKLRAEGWTLPLTEHEHLTLDGCLRSVISEGRARELAPTGEKKMRTLFTTATPEAPEGTLYDYIGREKNPYTLEWEYLLRSRGTLNSYGMVCNEGSRVRLIRSSNSDFYMMKNESNDCYFRRTLKIIDGKMTDVTDRMAGGDTVPFERNGVTYYTTSPRTLDGIPIK